MMLALASCGVFNKSDRKIGKARFLLLSINKDSVLISEINDLTYTLRITNITNNDTFETPKNYLVNGYKGQIENEYYLEILYSTDNVQFIPLRDNLVSYSTDLDLNREFISLGPGEYHEYSNLSFSPFHNLKKAGYYRIKCFTVNKFFKFESNEVLLKVKVSI